MVIRPHHIRSYLSLAVANVADLGEAQSHAQHRRRSVNDMLTGQHHDSGRSEIRLKGHLDSRWAAWFDRMNLINESDGITVIRGPVIDQAALHGLLQKCAT
jgi:hypothetical protein